jgi:homoserine kinase
MKTNSVVVRLPASTSNLGSGFDTLGLALGLYGYIRVTRDPRAITSKPSAQSAKALQLISEAARAFFKAAGIPEFKFTVEAGGNVPIGRGLGASAILRAGTIAGLGRLTKSGLTRQQLLQLVTVLEGHPDNASPAIFGGFTVSGQVNGVVRCLQFPVSPKLKFVILVPSFQVSTEQARKLMPGDYSKAEALHGLNRAALICAAFSSGAYRQLRGLFDDRIHQPYRAPLIPAMDRVIRAGERAGAIGGFLSGSGSAIFCVTLEKPKTVAQAMQRELPESEMKILVADNTGIRPGKVKAEAPR